MDAYRSIGVETIDDSTQGSNHLGRIINRFDPLPTFCVRCSTTITLLEDVVMNGAPPAWLVFCGPIALNVSSMIS